MQLSSLTNEELYTLIINRENATELETELIKRIIRFQDDITELQNKVDAILMEN